MQVTQLCRLLCQEFRKKTGLTRLRTEFDFPLRWHTFTGRRVFKFGLILCGQS